MSLYYISLRIRESGRNGVLPKISNGKGRKIRDKSDITKGISKEHQPIRGLQALHAFCTSFPITSRGTDSFSLKLNRKITRGDVGLSVGQGERNESFSVDQ